MAYLNKLPLRVSGKGPYTLHSTLSHMQLSEDTWFSLEEGDRVRYIGSFMESDITDICRETDIIKEQVKNNKHQEKQAQEDENIDRQDAYENPLSILAEAAALANDPSDNALSVDFNMFRQLLSKQPQGTAKGIYEKATQLRTNPSSIVPAPGCTEGARMVASTRLKDRPHIVVKGKSKGEYRCEKSCPHWSALHICSHSVATADVNGDLLEFLQWFAKKKANNQLNLTALVRTDMPQNPGKKGGCNATAHKITQKLPIEQRIPRTYEDVFGTDNSFFVKKMNNRIQTCQGCRRSVCCADGSIPDPPFDYCIARKERRSFYDQNGQKRTSSRVTDAHYHLHKPCILAADSAFDPKRLVRPDDLPEVHVNYLSEHFDS